jgi:hypothetical protein
MSKFSAVLSALIALSTISEASAGRRQQVVVFKPDATTARYDGVVRGYNSADFFIDARAGQTLKVDFKKTSTCEFVIGGPPDGAVFFSGFTAKETFSEVLKKSGRYRATVYQMRAFARRGRKCWYVINIELKD